MAEICAQCKYQRERLYWKGVLGNKHEFFKPMINDFKNILKIPKKFTDEFQGELSEKVTLRGPSGNNWTTTLAQRGRNFVLQEGWKKFVKDHSLDEGDLLVFRHVEDSIFDVVIFDDSGCEKEASLFVEIDGKFHKESCCSMHKVKKSQRGKELMEEDDDHDHDDDDDDDDGEEINDSDEENEKGSSGTNMRTGKSRRFPMWYKSSRRAITQIEKKKAYAKAFKLQTKSPSCMIVLKPSHVHHLFTLTVPRDFADTFLPKESQNIVLKHKSKTWQVNFKRREVQCTLNKGWAEFVLDNTLEIDDVCVFELASNEKNKGTTILNVHIFRVVEKTLPLKVVKPSKFE